MAHDALVRNPDARSAVEQSLTPFGAGRRRNATSQERRAVLVAKPVMPERVDHGLNSRCGKRQSHMEPFRMPTGTVLGVENTSGPSALSDLDPTSRSIGI